MYNGRLKQSRGVSALGFFGGILFVGIGVFAAIPTFGAFGVIWTLLAAGIAAFHGYGLMSKRGVSLYEAEIERAPTRTKSLSEKLQEIDEARHKGHLSDTEYQNLRKRILAE
jgi:hypothetical protein